MKNHSLLAAALCFCASVLAGEKDGKLDFIWVDVEGGGATLIVTPAGESILIDSGNPGVRDSGRIHKAATEAGLKKIDHLVVTHFHSDHFGGAAEVAKLIPIGTVWDNGIPEKDPDGRSGTGFLLQIKPYREMQVGKREVIKAGREIPLKQREGAPKLSVRCIGAKQEFIKTDGAAGEACDNPRRKEKDNSDNANSIVLLLEFGNFQFFASGDLTWNVEEQLACPKNLAGVVDVFQVGHHGLDQSNNPLLVRALQPTVTVMSNGTTKGCGPETFATLKSVPSIQAMYQMHKNLRPDRENNTAEELTANLSQTCEANAIHIAVEPDAANYTVSIPASNHSRSFQTK